MQITINISQKVIDNVCKFYKYPEMVYNKDTQTHDLPNPQTKEEFVKQVLNGVLNEACQTVETTVAMDAARTTAGNEFISEVVIS